MRHFASIILTLALLCVPALAQPARVYIAPDDHTDYFWSADDAQYRQAFIQTLDYYLDLADTTQGNDPIHQSRWNCDGHLWLWEYQQNKSPAEFQRLIDRIADGHISVPLNALCVALGGAPAEAVIRGMYYPGRIEREFDLRFRLAYMIENQTQPLGLSSLWAGAGAKYSWKGICGCDSQVPDAWDREHDIYRACGLDGAHVLMKWNSMLGANTGMGGYAEARTPSATVNFVTTNAPFNGFAARYPYSVIGCFGKGWDDIQTQTNQFVTTAQTMTNTTRQVIVSNEQDFFEDFETTYDVASLPGLAVSFGNEWELYSAGMAEVTARARRALEKLRAAEAMATIVSLHDRTFMDGRSAARDKAFLNWGLFWEHDFGMVGSPTGAAGRQKRIDWQHAITAEIEAYVDTLHDDAANALSALVNNGGSPDCFFVFNPLGWTRDDVADLLYDGPTPVHVVDVQTQDETPSQIVTRGGNTYLRILAKNVPPVGYRVFELREGSGTAFDPAATITPGAPPFGATVRLENDRYRLDIAQRGAITSLVDKLRDQREFVQAIGGRAMNDMGASSGTLSIEHAGPVSVCIKATAASPSAHESRITLHRDIDRIDVQNDITQNFGQTRTYAFGVNLTAPVVRHEEVGAILKARLPTDGGDYSPRNARYDWLTLNHFADMTGGEGVGITLSNADASFFKLGNSTASTLDTATPLITVLAGGNVVNGNNGIPNQGGDTHFTHRFALRTHDAYDPVHAMRTAMEHQNPLVARMISGSSASLHVDVFSAISVSNENVMLWALKPSEDGIRKGCIVRLWNISDAGETATFQLSPRPIASAMRTTHIETDEAAEPVGASGISPTFTRQQIRTFRLVSAVCGDFDADGIVDAADVAAFVQVLLGSPADPDHETIADVNEDGLADGADVPAFVACITAH